MEKGVKESLGGVMQAMMRLNDQFEDKVKALRLQGRDEQELSELIKGAMAMKDAAGIYLAWANHYIERLEKTEGLDLDELSEGGGRNV
ncbi:MAG: hypothetical protein HY201_02460 [Nitrospirae bacterium]|nr:hypothetical protein [Candidatus Troglogloeales bacterium]MBI3598306.1 hypothetical protein [Candidatus Troglogloeales bacterium]